MRRSVEVERWFASRRPPAEAAMRRVREIILAADPSMRERTQYGVTFSSTKSGDFASFVRFSEPRVDLRLHRPSRLEGRYPHLEGTVAKRMRIADEREARARAAEITAMVREWCALGATARRGSRADRPDRSRRAPRSGGAGRSSSR